MKKNNQNTGSASGRIYVYIYIYINGYIPLIHTHMHTHHDFNENWPKQARRKYTDIVTIFMYIESIFYKLF